MNLKLATINETPRSDPREALRAAIEFARAAREEVAKREAALDRGRALAVAAEDDLARITAAADKARALEGRRLAAAAMANKRPSAAGGLRSLRMQQIEIEDRVAATEVGIECLRDNITHAERERLEQDNAVLVEVNRVLAPVVQEVFEEAKKSKTRLIECREILQVLLGDFASPPHFEATTDEHQARQQRAAPIDAELRRQIDLFLQLAMLGAAEERDLAFSVQQTWRKFRETLRQDPEIPIPR